MKKFKDITLGEAQAECNRARGMCALCEIKLVCPTNNHKAPCDIDLTDPPRFDRAQMALLEALWINGALTICTCEGSITVRDKFVHQLLFADMIGMKENDYINLAELFGKEEGEKNQ